MNMLPNSVPWLADSTVRDLLQGFPLPIALLDDAGGAPLLTQHPLKVDREFFPLFSKQAAQEKPVPA